jgi:hypothetical protein
VLKDAYDHNDLQKVTEILTNLERGIFTARSAEVSEKTTLRARIIQLRRRREEVERALVALKQSDTYQNVSKIDNWDEYFAATKERLEKEWEKLCGT